MESANGNQSWNWAAFFLTPFWLLYRRLYACFAMYVVLSAGLVVIEELASMDAAAARAMHMGVAAVVGMFGNYLYRLHMQRKLASLDGNGTPEQQRIAAARAGGTSPIGPSLLLIVLVVLGLVAMTYPE